MKRTFVAGTVALGDGAIDLITGFVGVVTARAEYITGCTRFQVEGKDTKVEWFDEERLRITEKTLYVSLGQHAAAGPRSAPTREALPPR